MNHSEGISIHAGVIFLYTVESSMPSSPLLCTKQNHSEYIYPCVCVILLYTVESSMPSSPLLCTKQNHSEYIYPCVCVILLYTVESSMPSSPLLCNNPSRKDSWPSLTNSMVNLTIGLIYIWNSLRSWPWSQQKQNLSLWKRYIDNFCVVMRGTEERLPI